MTDLEYGSEVNTGALIVLKVPHRLTNERRRLPMAFLDFFDEPTRSRPRFSPREKDALFREQSGKCNGCRKKFAKRNLTVDHIRPFSQGGGERLNNLQLLCGACNSMKGDGTMAELRKKLRQQGVVKSSAAKTRSAAKTAKSTRKPKSTTRSAPKKRRTRKRDPVDEFLGDLFGL